MTVVAALLRVVLALAFQGLDAIATPSRSPATQRAPLASRAAASRASSASASSPVPAHDQDRHGDER
jgi:hypothetical protein